MAGSRTLKLTILGDVDNLNKSLKTAETDVDSFGTKMGNVGKKIGAAFAVATAAAAAYAVKIGIEGVQAAIADEKAQTQLALALTNAAGATDAQIKSTEAAILQMSLATGVADDDLRPALQRLVLSTGDVSKAQGLLSTALDVSTATGKPLETVANALGKAYDGNTAALGKLGIGLSSAELKSMSFEEVQGRLSTLFGGAAAANAETYAGKIARVQVAFNEAKETIGTALLPILNTLLDFINKSALPAINAFSDAFSLTGTDGFGKVISDVGTTIKKTVQPIFEGFQKAIGYIKDAIMDSKDEFSAFWDVIKYVAPLLGKIIGESLSVIGDVASVVITLIGKVLAAIKPLLNTAIDGINLIIKGINLIKPGADIGYVSKIGSTPTSAAGFSGTTPGGTAFSTGGGGTGTTTPTTTYSGGTGGGAGGGGGVATVAAVAAAASSAASNVLTMPFNAGSFRTAEAASMGTVINLTVTGAFDKEGTARTIIETLNDSYYRGTGGGGQLQMA